MRTLKDASVLVTGGGTGIGAAIAQLFVARGAKVTICGRREAPLRSVSVACGSTCAWLSADVSQESDHGEIISRAVEHGGGLDIVVHAAANMYRCSLGELATQPLVDVFFSNVFGPLLLTRAALPYLRDRNGCVVFISSVHVARAFAGATPYAATKGAIETASRVLAAELGPIGVRVGCVRPGAVLTELYQRAGLADESEARRRIDALAPEHVLGRAGTAEEVAEAVEYMARAEWTTGSVLTVDGGLSLGVSPTRHPEIESGRGRITGLGPVVGSS